MPASCAAHPPPHPLHSHPHPHSRPLRSIHTNYQALLNGNLTALSTLRLGDAKSIPAVDVMLRDGFPALCHALLPGLDVRYSTGAWEQHLA